MKAVSIHQPWASLIAVGEKRYETRSWSPKHRGPILIHASKAFSYVEKQLFYGEPFKSAFARHGMTSVTQLPARCPPVRLQVCTWRLQ